MPRPSIATEALRARLRDGLAIPAHPLALTAAGRLDERSQRALTRYYHAAGAGGVAVAVHTTQFAIRDPAHALFRPVLELAAETLAASDRAAGGRSVLVAGICGDTRQAVAEAALARELGYDAGLLSLAALGEADDDALVAHARRVAEILPVFGFYLQPAVGGRLLSSGFWERFVEIPQVVAVKVAPFNRYQTLDVIGALAASGRAGEIALYTGNDDSILIDLLTGFEVPRGAGVEPTRLHFSGGLLGHWACWTRSAVAQLRECLRARESGAVPGALLTKAAQVTEANAAVFDAAHGFAGCVAGIHHVLWRQGLLAHPRCLDPAETLSPGQAEAIDQIRLRYPWMVDDAFVEAGRDGWLA